MSRSEGFAIADTDAGLYADPKVSRLWRQVRPDVALMTAAMVVYEACRLASWRTGQRVPAEDAAPTWLPDVDGATVALAAVGLLDDDGRIPGPCLGCVV